jgi:hypothetical protein
LVYSHPEKILCAAMAKRLNMLQNKYHPGLCSDCDSNDFPQEFVIILPSFKTAV